MQLAPGAEETVLFMSGSDTFNPTRGAVLPPGDYLVVVRLQLPFRSTTIDGSWYVGSKSYASPRMVRITMSSA